MCGLFSPPIADSTLDKTVLDHFCPLHSSTYVPDVLHHCELYIFEIILFLKKIIEFCYIICYGIASLLCFGLLARRLAGS